MNIEFRKKYKDIRICNKNFDIYIQFHKLKFEVKKGITHYTNKFGVFEKWVDIFCGFIWICVFYK
jgi:hypothetical protein